MLALMLFASCAPELSAPALQSPSTPAPSASLPPVVERISGPRPPPATVTIPMTGEPAAAALSEARLVAASCEELDGQERARAPARIKRMRAHVDAAFRRWAAQQPECWRDYRRRARMGREGLWGDEISATFGYGVLGLSGVGAGGGGRVGGVRAASRASRTNNQVAGVDEADIVKTDGRYVYLAMNGALRIVEAMKPRVLSTTRVAGKARELFVEGDRAVVYTSIGASKARCTYGYDCQFSGDGSATQILVFDVANRARPKLLRRLELSGSMIAARRIGNAVHTVVADGDSPEPEYETWPADLQSCGTPQSVVQAKFARLKRDNERKILARGAMLPKIRERGVEQSLCGGLLRTALNDGRAFTTLVSFDLADDRTPATTATIQSRPGAVFASADALYLSVVQQRRGRAGRWYSFYPSHDEASEIHKFRIGASPARTRYLGSGIVPGHVLNQFSMDEWYGYLRIATSSGRVPDPRVESSVSVLSQTESGNLVRVGAVTGMAPGEDIRAVRFDGDRGYVVTFKKTDPLFVLDLYDPARPSILGELKIPGFSTYMHRIDPDHLLSIGFDADDRGDFAYFDGVILQLFDVRNPTRPELLFKEKIGTRGSSSEAATDHLAFNYFAEQKRLAIPITICDGGGDGRTGDLLAFSGLLVYDVSLARGFSRLGGIDHGKRGASCGSWWSDASSVVKRSIFLDELVYSIATDRLKVQRLGHFGHNVADIALRP
jgi:hypothetical protein